MIFFLMGILFFLIQSCVDASAPKSVSIPDYPVEKGVSAPFAGFSGDWLLVGGGCNFPGTPAAEGGKKVYYKEVYACHIGKEPLQWLKVGDLREPVAYGAMVETHQGIICIGGMSDTSSLRTVCRISLDSIREKLFIDSLPSLPETIDNAAAAAIGETVYVTGGNQGNTGHSLYALTLEKDTAWKRLGDYPGPKRIQPVLLNVGDSCLFLIGGFSVDDSTRTAAISSDYMVYNLVSNTWKGPQAVPTMEEGGPRAIVGCSGWGDNNRFFVAGGVNYEIFKSAVEGKAPADYMKRPADWYKFSKDLLIYDKTKRIWKVVPGQEGFNKAGGILLQHNGCLHMVCGETKPGIRTSEIVSIPLNNIHLETIDK